MLLQDPVVRPISEFDLTSLQDLVPEIPLWLKNPDYDRVRIFCATFIKGRMFLYTLTCIPCFTG